MANATELTATQTAATTNQRRIVKAAHPKALEEPVTATTTRPKTKKKDDWEPVVHATIIDEDPQEEAEEWRNERLKATEKWSKSKKEKELAERRKSNKTSSADATANPFSRFLSVFSVAASHPEHKRSLEAAESVEEEEVLPAEKRLKPSESSVVDDLGPPSEPPKGFWSSRWVLVTTVVAVAAVGVAIAMQRGRRK